MRNDTSEQSHASSWRAQAADESVLTPRFYTTDFDEMEQLFSLELNPNLNMDELEVSPRHCAYPPRMPPSILGPLTARTPLLVPREVVPSPLAGEQDTRWCQRHSAVPTLLNPKSCCCSAC